MGKLGYIRTSTDKQLTDRQVNQLQEFCDQVFIEDGVSAVRKQRPVYERVMKTLKQGDVFVVCSLDRAFRSYMDSSPIASQVLSKLMFPTEIEIAAIYSVF